MQRLLALSLAKKIAGDFLLDSCKSCAKFCKTCKERHTTVFDELKKAENGIIAAQLCEKIRRA
jgi:hypothetical protein